jgi:predicted ATPase
VALSFTFEATLSFIAHADEKTERSVLGGFRELVKAQVPLKPDPTRMMALADREDEGLLLDGSNFSSWFRWLIQDRPQIVADYFASLRLALPGFRSLFLESVGTGVKELRATFETPTGPIVLTSDELSEGQRQLLLLHMLVCALSKGRVLFLDEPDNFISIREVQPWLSELERVLLEQRGQAIIVSHGTEAMNYLGSRQAFVVTRPDGGATRIAPHDGSDGSMPSEVVLYGGGTEASASR